MALREVLLLVLLVLVLLLVLLVVRGRLLRGFSLFCFCR